MVIQERKKLLTNKYRPYASTVHTHYYTMYVSALCISVQSMAPNFAKTI
jgi:hypothetical protein